MMVLRCGKPVEGAQEGGQPIHLVLETAEVFACFGRGVLFIEQGLHHGLHAGQRVADLVRQAHGQFAHGGHLLALEHLPVQFASLFLGELQRRRARRHLALQILAALLQGLVGSLQALGHGIEAAPQVGDFVMALDLHAVAEIAPRDLGGLLAQQFDGPQHAARQHEADDGDGRQAHDQHAVKDI